MYANVLDLRVGIGIITIDVTKGPLVSLWPVMFPYSMCSLVEEAFGSGERKVTVLPNHIEWMNEQDAID